MIHAEIGQAHYPIAIDKEPSALAGVGQWIEHWPVNQRVVGSIPKSGHMPGLWARSPVEGA